MIKSPLAFQEPRVEYRNTDTSWSRGAYMHMNNSVHLQVVRDDAAPNQEIHSPGRFQTEAPSPGRQHRSQSSGKSSASNHGFHEGQTDYLEGGYDRIGNTHPPNRQQKAETNMINSAPVTLHRNRDKSSRLWRSESAFMTTVSQNSCYPGSTVGERSDGRVAALDHSKGNDRDNSKWEFRRSGE